MLGCRSVFYVLFRVLRGRNQRRVVHIRFSNTLELSVDLLVARPVHALVTLWTWLNHLQVPDPLLFLAQRPLHVNHVVGRFFLQYDSFPMFGVARYVADQPRPR